MSVEFPESGVRVVNGHIMPDLNTIRQVSDAILREVTTNPAAEQEFRRNPRRYLANRGLSVDLQRELLRDAGAPARQWQDIICGWTCGTGTEGCCFTCWGTVILFPKRARAR